MANRPFTVKSVASSATTPEDITGITWNSTNTVGTGELGFAFSSDGLLFAGTWLSNDYVRVYTLTTPFDLTTATLSAQLNAAVNASETTPYDVAFSEDKSKLYLVGGTADKVLFWTMSTPGDPTTATEDDTGFSFSSQATAAYMLEFKPDGTKFFIGFNTSLYEYTMSTPWDVTTASYTSSLNLTTVNANASGTQEGVCFNDDGTRIYTTNGSREFLQFNLSTPWDLSTATDSGNSSPNIRTITYNGSVYGIYTARRIKVYKDSDNNPRIFISGTSSSGSAPVTYEFDFPAGAKNLDLSSGDYFTFTPSVDTTLSFNNPPSSGSLGKFSLEVTGNPVQANALDTFSVGSSQSTYEAPDYLESSPDYVTFKDDGTKMWFGGTGSFDPMEQFSLSTPWDLSTASYDSTSIQFNSNPSGTKRPLFGDSGTKLYLLRTDYGMIYQWNLTTAWDISTASYASKTYTFADSNHDSFGDFWLSSDGTKLYITAMNNTFTVKAVHQHTLSTAWDISTASYDSVSFDNGSLYNGIMSVTITSDGLNMYLSSGSDVYLVTMSTAWNLSTASYASKTLSLNSGTNLTPFIKPDGKALFMVNNTTDKVESYIAPGGAITYPSSVSWSGGTAPSDPALNQKDILEFVTRDGGTSYIGYRLGS